jgi:hypothetical protein
MLMLDEEEFEMQNNDRGPSGGGDMMVEEFDFIGDNQNEEYVRVVNYNDGLNNGQAFISP